MNGRALGREAIIAAGPTLARERVYIEVLGGEVIVQELPSLERDEFEASVITGKGKNLDVVLKGIRAKMFIRSIVDEDGNRVFTDQDIAIVNTFGSRCVDQVFSVAQRLNGITNKDVEETAKNSLSVPSEESLSASP